MWSSVRAQILQWLDLRIDQADPAEIDAELRAAVVFRGTNLWVLVFAILVASIGLNLNSTAVVIGAMLISPLMGPIMGIGYGAGIDDFRLMRTSALNLAVATGMGLAASTLYFALTPLSVAHSELLARTAPTLWDVLIALFAGLAGIIAVTRREKATNVVAGVAIATALMPPLCTAGYGLAALNARFFLGAAYLFCINSVFIASATFAMVRFLRLQRLPHMDEQAGRRTRRWIAVVVVATALPSLWLAVGLTRAELFNARAEAFLADAFPRGGGTLIVARDLDPGERTLRVTVVGASLSDVAREALTRSLPQYGLTGARLVVTQNEQAALDVAGLRQNLTQDLYQGTLSLLEERDRQIKELEGQLAALRTDQGRYATLRAEIAAQIPSATEIVVGRGVEDALALVVVLDVRAALPAADQERLEAWLKVRTGAQAVRVVVMVAPPPRKAGRQ